jgi:hypothetical protein
MSLFVALSGPEHRFQAACFLWLQALLSPLVLFPPLIALGGIHKTTGFSTGRILKKLKWPYKIQGQLITGF